jgi:hypothetical protein
MPPKSNQGKCAIAIQRTLRNHAYHITQCDGTRPCHACKTRLTKCQDQSVHIVRRYAILSPEVPPAAPGPSAMWPKSQIRSLAEYLNLAQQFLGRCPSPMTNPFGTICFLHLVQENENIQDAVVAIGAAHAIHSQQATLLSEESGLADFLQRKLYAKFQARLREPDPYLDPSLIPLAVLLCIVQVRQDSTGSLYSTWTKRT